MTDKPPPVKLITELSGEKFLQLCPYPVIVECWTHKDNGRHKRAWLKEFSADERALISQHHNRFRDWHLHAGTPDKIQINLASLHLLQRACNFFGTI